MAIDVSPEYESARTVYLPDNLARVLADHLEKCPQTGAGRWLSSPNGYVDNSNSAGN